MTSKSLNVDRKKQYKGRRRGLRGKGIINILSFLKNDKLFIALKGGFFLNLFLFVYFFWLRWVFVAVLRLSLVVASGGYSSLWCMGFSLWWLLLWSAGSRQAHGLQ